MLEPAGEGSTAPRAFLRVAGKSVARHQLSLAIALEAQRIVCMARDFGPELIALQHAAERAGAQFHVVSGTRGLRGLVTANDDLLVLTDGLLVSPRDLLPFIDGEPVVLVQPVEQGVASGFERLDLNHASAGVMRIPGRLVDRLNELPPDCDTASALTRVALQSGIAQRMVPGGARETGHWQIVRTEAEAQAVEAEWFRFHMGGRSVATPVSLIAKFGLFAFGPALLHGGSGTLTMAMASLAAVLLAYGAGWFGFGVAGFLVCAVAAVLRHLAGMLHRIEDDSLSSPGAFDLGDRALAIGLDLVLVLLVIWNETSAPLASLSDKAFAPVVLIATMRLLPRIAQAGWAVWAEDRFVLSLLLAVAAMGGFLHIGTQALVLALILLAWFVPVIQRG